MVQSVEFNSVSFQYPEQSISLFEGVNLSFGPGWTACVGPNGGGKTTLLKLASGLLVPDSGTILHSGRCLYVPQQTEVIPAGFEEFIASYDRKACQLIGKLALKRDWLYRWEALSQGERKRAQIACSLWQESEMLAIDEPTNHLDGQAMAFILHSLSEYKGVGILVSHDRSFLQALVRRTVLVHAPYTQSFDCSYEEAIKQSNVQYSAASKNYQDSSDKLKKLKSELMQRSRKASRQDSLCSKRNLDPKDHDGKAKIDGVRISGSDGKAGKLKKQLEKRYERSQSCGVKEYDALHQTRLLDLNSPVAGITLSGSCYHSATVFRCASDALSLGPQRYLSFPPLEIQSKDHIGITGDNGLGKTTLLKSIVRLLGGSPVQFAYLPQEISMEESKDVMERMFYLNETVKGRVISRIVQLGSDSRLFLSSGISSPGEMKKLMLAMAMESETNLLVMDEPTNHLDLPSRLALEQALKGYQGAYICVSHDAAFLQQICSREWNLEKIDQVQSSLKILDSPLFYQNRKECNKER
ncbi:ATP-binding cassette domain-containing protein [uncultured Sphaerochaeta sp.]|uniref:ATP-binding cassette domain-containing protein n=1 Tax=uncultured Sphaerochaeta sp. TaxID=886478 RepID=UPI002A0A2F15|nr:ATP-binding cassette domain-containing protein [uncultured Sphaerochaeta sp.]